MFAPQRSQSGPGLSINTGAANSLTAPNSTQPATGGLFGSKPGSLFGGAATTTNSSAPSAAGTLFGMAPTKPSTTGSSLFGSTAAAPSQAGTLFGGSATAQPAQGTSLFGSVSNTANPAPTAQTSLFGGASTAAPAAMSLFGNTVQTQSQQQAGSLFGNPAPAQTSSLFTNPAQPQAAAGSSLLGSNPTQQPTTSLFGNTATINQQPPQNSSLFGAPQQAGNMFGVSQNKNLFGASQNTQGGLQHSTLMPAQRTQRSMFTNSIGAYTAEQQAVPGVRINLSELRPTTRFNDLYEGVQKEIENIDTFISNQIKLAEECEGVMPHNASTILAIPPDVSLCERKMEALERALEADAAVIDEAKRLARKDAEAARLSFKAISSIRMPAHLQSSTLFRNSSSSNAAPTLTGTRDDSSSSADLLGYFNTQTDEMRRKLDAVQKQLGEVESYVSSVEAHQVAQIQSARLSHGRDGGVKSAEDQIKEMAATLQSFEGGILSVASRLTSTRESLGGLIVGESSWRGGR